MSTELDVAPILLQNSEKKKSEMQNVNSEFQEIRIQNVNSEFLRNKFKKTCNKL